VFALLFGPEVVGIGGVDREEYAAFPASESVTGPGEGEEEDGDEDHDEDFGLSEVGCEEGAGDGAGGTDYGEEVIDIGADDVADGDVGLFAAGGDD
jgi:hypothetical protein